LKRRDDNNEEVKDSDGEMNRDSPERGTNSSHKKKGNEYAGIFYQEGKLQKPLITSAIIQH
jgi:hypothetical protein